MPAAPPAPTAAPAPKAAPQPAAKPQAAPQPKAHDVKPPEIADQFPDAFADIDEMDKGKKPEPKKEAVKKADPTESGAEDLESDTTSTSASEDSAATNADTSSQQTKSDSSQKDGKPFKAKELRDAYEGLKKKIKEEYEPKVKRIAELEAKLKELDNPEKQKQTQAEVESIRKRNEELESAIRLHDYKRSQEYKKHQEALTEVWTSARDKLAGINITIKDGDSEEIKTRELTLGDIAGYANLEPKDRWTKLRNDIPDPAERTMVINHIDKIIDTNKSVEAAEKKANEDAAAYAKTAEEQQQQAVKNREKFWRESNEFYTTKYPQWFGKSDDAAENAVFDKGRALSDLVFFPTDLTPEKIALLPKSIQEAIQSKKPFSQQQMAKLHSIIANKAANHDRLVHRLKARDARIAELEKSLKEYEESGPDNVRAGTVNGHKSDIPDAMAELDSLDKKFGRR